MCPASQGTTEARRDWALRLRGEPACLKWNPRLLVGLHAGLGWAGLGWAGFLYHLSLAAICLFPSKCGPRLLLRAGIYLFSSRCVGLGAWELQLTSFLRGVYQDFFGVGLHAGLALPSIAGCNLLSPCVWPKNSPSSLAQEFPFESGPRIPPVCNLLFLVQNYLFPSRCGRGLLAALSCSWLNFAPSG